MLQFTSLVDNNESSVCHIFARSRIGQRHPIPLRIICETGCNIAIFSEKKCKKDQIPITYLKVKVNVLDVQRTQINILGTAVYFISLEEHGTMRQIKAVVAEKLHGDEIIINVSKLIDMGISPKNWPAPNKEIFKSGIK